MSSLDELKQGIMDKIELVPTGRTAETLKTLKAVKDEVDKVFDALNERCVNEVRISGFNYALGDGGGEIT